MEDVSKQGNLGAIFVNIFCNMPTKLFDIGFKEPNESKTYIELVDNFDTENEVDEVIIDDELDNERIKYINVLKLNSN